MLLYNDVQYHHNTPYTKQQNFLHVDTIIDSDWPYLCSVYLIKDI